MTKEDIYFINEFSGFSLDSCEKCNLYNNGCCAKNAWIIQVSNKIIACDSFINQSKLDKINHLTQFEVLKQILILIKYFKFKISLTEDNKFKEMLLDTISTKIDDVYLIEKLDFNKQKELLNDLYKLLC